MIKNFTRIVVASLSVVLLTALAGCNREDVEFDNPILESGYTQLTVDNAGTAVELPITSNRSWQVEIADENGEGFGDWVKISPESGRGNHTVSIGAEANPGRQRVTRLRVSTSIAHEYVTVTQRPAAAYAGGEVIYTENVGADPVSSPTSIEYFTAAGGWNTGGTAARGVTYSGNNIDIRSTLPSSGYDWAPDEQASGGNSIFFGGSPQQFIIGNIKIGSHTDFILTFGVSREDGSGSFVPVDDDAIKLYASVNGVNYTPLKFSNASDAGWVLATSEFKAVSGSNTLWIMFDLAPEEVVRIDDFRLEAGGLGFDGTVGELPDAPVVTTLKYSSVTAATAVVGGAYIAPANATISEYGVEYRLSTESGYHEAVGDNAADGSFSVSLNGLIQSADYVYRAYVKVGEQYFHGEPMNVLTSRNMADVVYYEDCGATEVYTDMPVTSYIGWSKLGTGARNVVYGGSPMTKVNRRISSAGFYNDASGGNSVIFGNENAGTESRFESGRIIIEGGQNYRLVFGISRANVTTPGNVGASPVKLAASEDGVRWTELTYTYRDDVPAWVTATSQLRMAAESKELYIRFYDPAATDIIRIDDITLIQGGDGTTVVGDEPGITRVITHETPSFVGTQRAIVGGSYYESLGGTPTQVGIKYSKNDGADHWTTVQVATVTSPFETVITGLEPATEYKYHAYAIVGGHEVRGAEYTFTTLGTVAKTISQVRSAFIAGEKVTSGWSIEGIVASDRLNANFDPSSLVVEQINNQAGLVIKLSSGGYSNSFLKWQRVSVDLTGGVFNSRDGVKEVILDAAAIRVVNSATDPVPATDITPSQFAAYESMYVSVADAQAVNTLGTMRGTREFEITGGGRFTVYTRPGASFASTAVPTGKGYINGIVSRIDGAYCLMPTSSMDFSGMTGNRDGAVSYSAGFTAEKINTGEVIQGGQLTIKYSDNPSAATRTVRISSSDAGVDVVNTSSPFARGDGTLTYNITGTPVSVDNILFTVEIAGSVATTCTAPVNSGGAPGEQQLYYAGFEDTGKQNAWGEYMIPQTWTSGGRQWSFAYADVVATGTQWAGSNNIGLRALPSQTYVSSAQMTTNVGNADQTITKVTFDVAAHADLDLILYYSTDNGANWTPVATYNSGSNGFTESKAVTISEGLNITAAARFRFESRIRNGLALPTARDAKVDEFRVYRRIN